MIRVCARSGDFWAFRRFLAVSPAYRAIDSNSPQPAILRVFSRRRKPDAEAAFRMIQAFNEFLSRGATQWPQAADLVLKDESPSYAALWDEAEPNAAGRSAERRCGKACARSGR